jgi:hypothetical protein
MQRAGHQDFETTRIYLREAENLAAGFGTVFPPLSTDVLRGFASVSDSVTGDDENPSEIAAVVVEW